jgi:beta-barrel assembly-enhancing protease
MKDNFYNPSMISNAGFRFSRKVLGSWTLVILFLLNSCSSHQMPSIPGITPPGEDEEVKISREFRREARKQFKFVSNLEVQRYVDNIGRRLLSVMGPRQFDYRFFVIEESELNAFSVPGGSIYLYTGLLDRMKSTDELASVMAHETIHARNHHMVRMSGLDPVSILGILGAVAAARSGAGSEAALMVGQGISAARQIGYTRQLEMEADTLGLKYMAEAGYDPHAMLSFQKTMLKEQNLSPIDVPRYLLDHPLTQERIANVELMIRSMNPSPRVVKGPDPIKKIQTLIRIERHQTDAVIAEQRKLIRDEPKNSEPYQLLGIAYFAKGMWQPARENLEQAMALNPSSPGIDWDLGRLYTRIKNYPAAHAAFDRALERGSDEALTDLYLGELYEQESDLRDAAGAYLNASNLAPLWDKPPQQLGLVYGKLNRMGDAYYYLGKSLALEDEDEKAIPDYEKAIKILGKNSPQAQLVEEELKTLKARKQ